MKNIFKILAVVVCAMMLSTESAWAGNDDRRGTAGASELLINPWAGSAGWGGVNIANTRGLESFFTNIAGLTYVSKTELAYHNTMWLGGKSGLNSGASINAFGIAQRVSDQGVLGLYVMAMGFGDIDVTTVNSPEPGFNGTYSPSYLNINLAYAHAFSQSIRGGAAIKVISESVSDVSATGFAIDAGIQYVTGADDELKFGISMKNIGSTMSFNGPGLSLTMINDAGNSFTVETRDAKMELPTCLNIGLSYDFLMAEGDHRLTLAGSFTSNAFLKDNFTVGLEYGLFDIMQIRAGYVFQRGIFKDYTAGRTAANTGLCAGATFKIPLSKKDDSKCIKLEYAYRTAYPLKGTHTIGGSINL